MLPVPCFFNAFLLKIKYEKSNEVKIVFQTETLLMKTTDLISEWNETGNTPCPVSKGILSGS